MRRETHTPKSVRHPAGKASIETLLGLARIWMDARTGLLQIGGETATLVRGEPLDIDDLQLIIDGLYRGGKPAFSETDHPSRGVTNRLGLEIWKAVSRIARKTQMRGTASCTIHPAGLFRRLSAFPMQPETVVLLARVESGRVRVGDTVRLDKPTRMEVLEDLARLKMLGVIRLEKADERLANTRREARRKPSSEGVGGGRSGARSDPRLGGRLSRELERIEGLDDWAAVGCNPSMAPGAIAAQCQRMIDRYSAIIKDRSQTADCRELARDIFDHVVASADRIQEGKARREARGANPSTAYDDGISLVAQGRFDEAVKAFGLAQQYEPYAPRHTAWLGYAVFHDPTRDLAERQRKGRKLIEKALLMGTGNGDPNFVQAKLLVEDKDLVRAWNHVEVCLRANPTHSGATTLRDSIQREIKRDN
ncbi:MAG TPA: hypothetical protein QGF58_26210 [Myxococcota bacterium]|nr:hypothetical protein [Myxococcota bacterium]